jgi:hypothetical protein
MYVRVHGVVYACVLVPCTRAYDLVPRGLECNPDFFLRLMVNEE